jgi:hypothetical protein
MREAPELEEYTFPSTGVTVRIRKVSPLLSQEVLKAWQKKNPEPEPPLEEIKYGVTTRLEPNYSNPHYLQARRRWVERMNVEIGEQTLRLMIKRGVVVDLPMDEIAAFKAQFKEETDIDIEGDDLYIYIAYMCVGTDADIEDLRDKIMTRSAPTEKKVEEKITDFPGKS